MSKSTDSDVNFDLEGFSKTYAVRDRILLLLGFVAYSDYLQSDLWDFIKQTLKQESGNNKCAACRSVTGLCWHHRTYSANVLVGNFTNAHRPIVRLCNRCHMNVHSDGVYWFSITKADKRLQEMCETFDGDSLIGSVDYSLECNHSQVTGLEIYDNGERPIPRDMPTRGQERG